MLTCSHKVCEDHQSLNAILKTRKEEILQSFRRAKTHSIKTLNHQWIWIFRLPNNTSCMLIDDILYGKEYKLTYEEYRKFINVKQIVETYCVICNNTWHEEEEK